MPSRLPLLTCCCPKASTWLHAQNATVGSYFDLSIVNIGTSSGAVTLAVNTGVTDGGNALVAIAVTTSQLFRFRKTGDGTYVVYRLG
jgi:hypothetical protein